MMFSEKLIKEMNVQIRHELYSAYLYLSMASHFDAQNLKGFGHWMKVQAKEEMEHGMKFYEYLNSRGAKVNLEAIEQPPLEFGTLVEIFEMVLGHEKSVTDRINLLYSIAVEDKDYASQSFLNWFVDEQVEEEEHAGEILETLKKVGDKGTALFMLDRSLGGRAE
ncbi:MAG: Ferritin [Anaerolinea thermophila]|uniref:Ferritin n=1 Tax=Anaerolinea thermophila TaxID=167964 RepID=A0A101FY50_9CHLR|nr:MAG: Ferritin [Anaerolinea thermophila]